MDKKHLLKLKEPTMSFEPFKFKCKIESEKTHLIGFEFDGTACFRKGARLAPDEIRRQSPDIESYSPYLDADTENINVVDLGNLPVGTGGDIEANWQQATDYFFAITADLDFKKQAIKFLTLGGEHSISYAPILSYLKNYPDLLIIQLDAHADLRDGYEGYHYSHASIMCRVIEKMGSGHSLMQYGIRSGTKDEYMQMHKQKTLLASRKLLLEKLENIDNNRAIYVTLDLDYFDPAFLPGTGTPEPGGENFDSFVQICKVLKSKNVVGADIVELAPNIDPTGNSSVFAAVVTRELLLVMA